MRLTAGAQDAGLRLDAWISRLCPALSRTRIQHLIAAGHITPQAGLPDGALRPAARVRPGWCVEVVVPPPVAAQPAPEAIPLDVLHEDDDLIVIAKPAGLVVHPAAGHADGTLVNALLHHCDDLEGIGGELRPGIVHRLDKDTSGVLVAAKTQAALDALAAQFKAGVTRKTYLALVHGAPRPSAGQLRTQIGRSPRDRKRMAVLSRGGRLAVTHYETTAVLGACSLLTVRIETGRTHQIRVHLAHLGHPVVGDPLYGRPRADRALAPLPVPARQMLHAWRLEFEHPRDNRRLTFEAPLPPDFQALLDALSAGGATAGAGHA